jgi:hypothetical protein
MGINTITTSTASQDIRVVAGTSITTGDLVVNTDTGNTYVANSALTITQNNTTTSGPNAIYPATVITSGGYYGTSSSNISQQNAVQLSTGNIVFAYPGDGTSSKQTNLNIALITEAGNTPYPITVISDTSISSVKVRKIGTTGFVAAWTSGTTLKFAIYNNDTTNVIGSTTVVTLATFGTGYEWDINVTASNDIVFAYWKTGGNCAFTRYNSSGTVQGSEVTVEATASPNWIRILPNAAGGFWVYYYRSAATVAWKFARYNSTGTLQGALTSIATGSAATTFYSGAVDNIATELPNGNVVLFYCSTSNYLYYAVYSSTGTVVKAGALIDTTLVYAYPQVIPGICISGANFAIATMGSTYTAFYLYNSSGGSLINRTTINPGTTIYNNLNTSSTSNNLQLFNNGNASFIAYLSQVNAYGCNTTYPLVIMCFTTTGAMVGTPVVLYPYTSNYSQLGINYSLQTTDGSLFFNLSNASSNMQIGTYSLQAKSVIGVAQESFTAGNTGRIATLGTYSINQNFYTGGTFDKRAATVPGAKGTVVGSTAVLSGLV